MTAPPDPDFVLDCRGTLCPIPVLRLRQEIDRIEAGKIIRVLATDPASVQDMPAFARNTGHELILTVKANGAFEFYFMKSAEDRE